METKYLALIPARGGSKGVPRKNLELVGSWSLLERAVFSGQRCAQISSCFVSSEDEEILSKSRNLGAIPHRRMRDAASDEAHGSLVVDDFLLSHPELSPETRLVYLQPSSPFRTFRHVEGAIETMESIGANALVSVVRAYQFPEKVLKVSIAGSISTSPGGVDPGANRQRFPETVYPNGAIYIFTVGAFRETGEIPVFGAYPYRMGKVQSIDIDDPEDLVIARGVAAYAGI